MFHRIHDVGVYDQPHQHSKRFIDDAFDGILQGQD
jgi:hypothetical protein